MTINNRVFLVAMILAVLLAGEVCFATDDGDFQWWSAAGLSFDVSKDWEFTFKEELRFEESARNLYHHHSEAGFVYKSLADWMDLGFNYRQAYEKDSAGKWREENQPSFHFTLKGKLLGLDISDRSRFEYRHRENRDGVWRYRNKVTVKLPLELTSLKLKPYLADEIFITLNDDNVDRNRFYAGASFKLAKNLKGDVYYMWQSSRASDNWTDINVLGTALKFSF